MTANKELLGIVGLLLFMVQAVSLFAQAAKSQEASPNRVLDLDGSGSYVELPPNILNNLDEATVEAWVKWRSLPPNQSSRFFSYGEPFHDTGIQASPDGTMNIFFQDHQTGLKNL